MNLPTYIGYPQRRLALEAAIGATIHKSGRRYLRRRLAPGLSELASLTDNIYTDPAALLGAPWAAPRFGLDQLAEFTLEHQQLQTELRQRYEARQLAFPTTWGVETGTSLLLYALVRGLRPSVVIEMGVGNGQSSFYMLRALQANHTGQLHSFDIFPQAGGLVSDQERSLWDFRLIDRWRGAKSLVGHLATLPKADICFHDADHGYLAQSFEFARLWDSLTEAGILISDDVDASYAFIDFCSLDGKRPDILIDRRKVVGVLHHTAHGGDRTASSAGD